VPLIDHIPQSVKASSCDPACALDRVSYGLGMPAMKQPTSEEAAIARRRLLDGLGGDEDIFEIMAGFASLHPRGNTFPGEVFLRLAAEALGWCGASQADPVPLEGIRERFLPECSFRGRENRKLQFAVLAVAALCGGAEPARSVRSHGGRPTTSGNTPCSQRLPISASPPTGRACRCLRYAGSWLSSRVRSLADPGCNGSDGGPLADSGNS
jgi:hypothetical protein